MFLCTCCLGPLIIFQSINEVEFTETVSTATLDIIKQLNALSMKLDNEDDNIKTCKYYYYEELKTDFKHGKEIAILHVNIVSLRKKFNRLEQLLYGITKLHEIIALSETRLMSYHDDASVPTLEECVFITHDSTTSAGGVGMYIKKHA